MVSNGVKQYERALFFRNKLVSTIVAAVNDNLTLNFVQEMNQNAPTPVLSQLDLLMSALQAKIYCFVKNVLRPRFG